MTTPSALPENHILQVPMSFTPAAFLDAPFRWRGHELNLLSIKETDGVAEPLPVWKGFAVREGAIIALAGLILASSYFLRSNHALVFLKNSGVRSGVVLVTALTVVVREKAFKISRIVTSNLIKNGEYSLDVMNDWSTSSDLQYGRLKAAQTNMSSYTSTLSYQERKDSKVCAYALYHLLRNPSLHDQVKSYIGYNNGCFFEVDFFTVFSHLFSPIYRSNLTSKGKQDLLDASVLEGLFKVCFEGVFNSTIYFGNADKSVQPFIKVLINYIKNRAVDSAHACTLLVLGELHKALVEAGLSIVEDQGHKGITREFYERFVNSVGGSDVLPSFDKFLEMVSRPDLT